jgi:mannose-6-phosphate isomerase-like protein (cupin superfamily)
MPKQFRRVVTGHNAEGKSCVIFDGTASNVRIPPNEPNVAMTDFWYSDETPASNAGNKDNAVRPLVLQTPPKGSIFRVVELPPDSERNFSNLKGIDGGALQEGQRHAGFHRTKSLDYIFVMEGELYCLLDEGEVLLKAGDFLIQRGTNHAWSNRSNKRVLILGVMLDAQPL